MEEVEIALVEARGGFGALVWSSDRSVLGGSGNRDLRLFLRGSLNRVVVVEMVCVVVVVAYVT